MQRPRKGRIPTTNSDARLALIDPRPIAEAASDGAEPRGGPGEVVTAARSSVLGPPGILTSTCPSIADGEFGA
ncbi:MAG: hypothetical protein CME06_09630 [Gemmatimonadetes bacterium]|nr:hypothetical protein [Gemmatimonadota bacterium]